jgi:hypothetical protein
MTTTTTTATTTAATATTTRILTNRKAYTTPPSTSATGSSTTTAGTTSAIHTPAPDATTRGLNQNSTVRESNTISIMANKRQLAERKRQLQNNHQATLDPSAGAKPGAVSVDGPEGSNHRESEDYDSLESPPLEETVASLTPRTGATTTTQSSSLISNPHILCAELVDEDEIRQMAQEEFQRMMDQAAFAQATLFVDVEAESQVVNTKPQRRPWIIACYMTLVVVVVRRHFDSGSRRPVGEGGWRCKYEGYNCRPPGGRTADTALSSDW